MIFTPLQRGRAESRAGGVQAVDRSVDHGRVDDETFWLRHLRLGLVLYVLGVVVALVYLAVGDPLRPGPSVVIAIVALSFMGLVGLLPHERIVRSRFRPHFFYAFSGSAVALVLSAAAIDGGANSPMTSLLVLASLYAALAYPPAAVVAVAASCGTGYVALAVLGPPAENGEVVMLTGSLLCAGVTAASVARSRRHAQADLAALHAQLAEFARTDDLTGCLTRRAFHDAVAVELARAGRHLRPVSLLMVDLDDFKSVNDVAGHLAGDELLARVGEELRASLRPGDDAGRVGGDEFAVLLADAGPAAAAAAGDRLLDRLRDRGAAASIGVGSAHPGDDVPALLARADAALYEAKRKGKGRVTSFV
jgi:diguanylate cyclase (GGDEF)-like protein